MEKVTLIQRKLLVSTLLVVATLVASLVGGAFALSSAQVRGSELVGFYASLGAPILLLLLLVLPRVMQASSKVTALAAAVSEGDGRFDRGDAIDTSAALLTRCFLIGLLAIAPGLICAHGFWGPVSSIAMLTLDAAALLSIITGISTFVVAEDLRAVRQNLSRGTTSKATEREKSKVIEL